MAKEKESKKCTWCGHQIEVGQITSDSYDGEKMHFGCAAQCDDPDIPEHI